MSSEHQEPDDHEEWWASQAKSHTGEYDGMSAATRAYKERALRSFNNNLFPQNSDTARAKYLWINDDHGRSIDTNMFELTAEPGSLPAFEDACDLLMYATSPPVSAEPCRRIIIMEDISQRFAELLGVRLAIPSEFFFAHCRETLDLSIVDETVTAQHGQYWRVPIPQRRWLPADKDQLKGTWYLESGFFYREQVYISERCGTRINFESQVSFWATDYGSGSWTVLLLVDPFRTNLLYKQNLEKVVELCQHDFSYRYRTEVLASGSEDRLVQAEHRCTYHTLLNAHHVGKLDHTCTPSSATAFARNLIRSSWEERIHRAEWDLYDQMRIDDIKHRKYQGVSDRALSSERRNQNAMWYQDMIAMRRDFNLWRRKVKNINHALVAEEIEPRVEPELRAAAQLALERERRSWARLIDKLATMEATISNHMEEYSQRAAMEESFAAGRQARSAGQLTKIATVIVPCTFVASIFSMGGSFAAGEDLFYVYWAISVPMTAALLVWVIHKEVLEWWKDPEEKSWVDRKKAALQDRMLKKRAESRDVEKGEEGVVREEKKEL
ncbi:hypothetical protein EKO04_005204 [Ascochyta lentis]|uniref:Uncharacterized protein n=1 Tax=Ascochyta lentis TaxID=205686 RepID=A0A8H7J4G6_9PLEO|nr:hypothetical protein EKO04_005204 [Ascochyta lentis]